MSVIALIGGELAAEAAITAGIAAIRFTYRKLKRTSKVTAQVQAQRGGTNSFLGNLGQGNRPRAPKSKKELESWNWPHTPLPEIPRRNERTTESIPDHVMIHIQEKLGTDSVVVTYNPYACQYEFEAADGSGRVALNAEEVEDWPDWPKNERG